MRDNAVVEARPVAVWVSPSGYGFERWSAGQWQESDEKPFLATDWKAGTRALVGNGDGRLMLHFDSTGLPSEAANIELVRDDERVTISMDGAGKVRVRG
jgi:general secretion pathway protein H